MYNVPLPRDNPKVTSPSDLLASAPPTPLADAPRAAASLTQPQGAEAAGLDGEPSFIEHVLCHRDTLQGLALRYGVNPSEIKLVNDLATDNLSVVKTLRIPKGNRILPKPQQIQIDPKVARVREFRVKNKLTEREAKYYMESADYDIERAQREYSRDSNFAKDNAASEQRMLAEIASAGSSHSRKGMQAALIGATVANVLRQGRDIVQSLLPTMPPTQETSPLLGQSATDGPSAVADSGRDKKDEEDRENASKVQSARATGSSGVERTGIELRQRRAAAE